MHAIRSTLAACTGWVLTLVFALLFPVAADAAPLFLPVPMSQAATLDNEQSQALEHLRSAKTSRNVRLVRLNLEVLQHESLEMNLRGTTSSRAVRARIDQRSSGDYTWFGELADLPGDAILVVQGDVVEGTVHHGTEVYRIQSVGRGLHALTLIDNKQFPPDEPPSFQLKELYAPQIEKAATNISPLDSSVSAEPAVIDVLVAYTASAESAKGGAANMAAMIQLAIDETNQSYQNSRINARLRLAKTSKVSYSESGRSYDTILAHFAGTSDGFMDDVHTQRNTYAADVAVLIINQSDYCGIADAILAKANSAFALVHYSCATGYYSFGHEIGHLQGARHNPEADPSTTPFDYGHGYRYGNSWRTVMAYNCNAGCTRIKYWSNPDVTYGGVPMGTTGVHNNARVLNTTAATVATFRNPDGTIWQYTGTPCSGGSCPGWQALDNNPATVTVAAGDGTLYQLHNDGKIWRYTGTPCSGSACPGWQLLDNNSKTLTIIAAGSALYQLHSDGAIWRYTGTPCSGSSCPGWQKLDGNLRSKAIVAAGTALYQLHDNGLIWRYTGTPCSGSSCPGWQLLDNNPATRAIVAAGSALYQLHGSGAIWRYTGTPCSGSSCPGWQLLDNNPKGKAIAAAGSALFQLHNDGAIWRYTGTPCSGSSCLGWQQLDNNPKGTAISAAGSELYQLHNDGMVWRHTGTPCSGSSCPGWQMLDNNPKTKAIDAAGTALYQVHGN